MDIQHGDRYTSIMNNRGSTVLTDPRPMSDSPVPDAQAIIDEARRHQRRRQRRVAVLITILIVVLGAVALFKPSVVFNPGAPSRTGQGTPTNTPLVNSPTPLTLDLFRSAPTPTDVSVDLATGAVRTSTHLGLYAAMPRQGYVLGYNVSPNGTYGAFSYDLRHTLSTWTGRYGTNPVPANDPRFVWVSSWSGTATEVNQNEQPVAPTVAIPALTLVVGQAGPNLVLTGSPPLHLLELWSPTQQRILATLGSGESLLPDVSAGTIVWSERNVVNIDRADGSPGPVLLVPSGDVARFLAISPDGSKVAIVFQPAPGTPRAGKGGHVVIEDIASGVSTSVTGSTGALDLFAWSPDSSRVFFPQLNRADTLVSVATYRIGSRQAIPLPIPGLHLPRNLHGAWASILVGSPATEG